MIYKCLAKYIVFIFLFYSLASGKANHPGTLTEADLSKAGKFFDETELEKMKGHFSKWVCINPKSSPIVLKCDDLGINEIEGPKEELQIVFSRAGLVHEYGLRHGITRIECRRIYSKLEAMKSKSAEICFRGDLASSLTVTTGMRGNQKRVGWVFDEAKTEKETACEFNGCD